MPWLNVPASRQAVFVPPPQPRGGLLGGSGSQPPKMSKLQALAAQRKRKAEEAKKVKGTGSSANGAPGDADVRELRNKAARLSISADTKNSSRGTTGAPPQVPPAAAPSPMASHAPRSEPTQMDSVSESEEALVQEQRSTMQGGAEPPSIAQPSTFAQALFGSKRKRQPKPQEPEAVLLAVPSLSRAPASTFDAFLEPSPDDVVLEAQAKGWRRGQAKK